MEKKINYSEGDCFSIPLRSGYYARGVVARMDGKGIIFGYFFDPKIESNIKKIISDDLSSEQAILSGQFGDLGFLNGEWKVIKKLSGWSRDKWIMPPFLRADLGDLTGILSIYDEDSLKCISENKVQISELSTKNLPEDGVMGYGYVEIKLTKLLSQELDS